MMILRIFSNAIFYYGIPLSEKLSSMNIWYRRFLKAARKEIENVNPERRVLKKQKIKRLKL